MRRIGAWTLALPPEADRWWDLGMGDCCDPQGYEDMFTGRFARKTAKRYRKRGLTPPERQVVEFVTEQGIEGASVLEIGGGAGAIQVELLRRGAGAVTNLELSGEYELEAARLLDAAGMAGRVDRRLLDIAGSPEEVEPADIVVLHRVVCCYPDYERLLGAAAQHARRVLVFSHPPVTPITRTFVWAENLGRRIRGNSFRVHLHSPEAMATVVADTGMHRAFGRHSRAWDVAGFARA